MELLAFLRVLWRFRIAVALGAVVAIALGVMVATAQTSRFGVASMRVIVDTPSSQTVDVNPVGVTTLEWRTGLFADLMATDEARESIARKLGIAPDSLVVAAPYMSVPAVPVPLPRAALEAARTVPEPYELGIQAAPLLPIIGIDARAPSPEQAARLASAAADELKAAAAVELTRQTQTFVAEPVGPPKAREVVNGPGRLVAVAVIIVAFGVWCAGIGVIDALKRSRRRRWPEARAATVGWP